jgi:hypothetical protein
MTKPTRAQTEKRVREILRVHFGPEKALNDKIVAEIVELVETLNERKS